MTILLKQVVLREIKEEIGVTTEQIRFNYTQFFEPPNTLMCNSTAFVGYDNTWKPNSEIDYFAWFSFAVVRKSISPNSFASYFLYAYRHEVDVQ